MFSITWGSYYIGYLPLLKTGSKDKKEKGSNAHKGECNIRSVRFEDSL